MKIKEIVDRVSKFYREECTEIRKLKDELNIILRELADVNYTKGENIYLSRYNYLLERKKYLEREIELRIQYCDGISL